MTLPIVIGLNVLIVIVLGLLAKFIKVGQAETTKGGWNFGYTTSDIIIIAVVAAISGVINTGISQVWSVLNTAGPLYGAILQGAFMWNYLLVFFLVRKPGSMLLVALLEVGMESLLGNTAGFAAFGWGLTQGLAAEAVMMFVNYGVISWWIFGLAGAAASQFGTVWTFKLFGWDYTQTTYWLAAVIDVISGFIFSGLLGWWLGKTVERSGLLRTTRKE